MAPSTIAVDIASSNRYFSAAAVADGERDRSDYQRVRIVLQLWRLGDLAAGGPADLSKSAWLGQLQTGVTDGSGTSTSS